MSTCLTDSLDKESCRAAVIAVLRGRGLATERAAELADEAVAFSQAEALRRQPTFDSDEHCRNWLIRVAVPHALQALPVGARAADMRGAPGIADMRPALALLPDEDHRLIERRFFDGLTLQELVEEFSLGDATAARKRTAHILGHLRELLEKNGRLPEAAGPSACRKAPSFWSAEWLALRAAFDENRARFPAHLLSPYRGQVVAWLPDGSAIRAADATLEQLDNQLRTQGEDPSSFVYEPIPCL